MLITYNILMIKHSSSFSHTRSCMLHLFTSQITIKGNEKQLQHNFRLSSDVTAKILNIIHNQG